MLGQTEHHSSIVAHSKFRHNAFYQQQPMKEMNETGSKVGKITLETENDFKIL